MRTGVGAPGNGFVGLGVPSAVQAQVRGGDSCEDAKPRPCPELPHLDFCRPRGQALCAPHEGPCAPPADGAPTGSGPVRGSECESCLDLALGTGLQA